MKAIKELFSEIKSVFPSELKKQEKAIFSYRYSNDYLPLHKAESTECVQMNPSESLCYDDYITSIGYSNKNGEPKWYFAL